MKFCGRTQMLWDEYSLSDSLGIIKKLGFDGAEICLENKHFEYVPTYAEDYIIDHTKDLCEELELQPNSVGCHIDFVHSDDNFSVLKSVIPKIPKYGTNIFILGGCTQIANLGEERKTYGSRMREMARIAEDHGVLLAPEPEVHCILRTTQDMLDLLDDIQSPSLKVNLDIGHAFLTDADPIDAIRKLEGHIEHLHIENMYRGWHNHQLPQAGDMDLGRYLRVMKDLSFDGPAALDLYNVDLQEIAPESLAYLRKLDHEV